MRSSPPCGILAPTMRDVRRSALLPYSTAQVYGLVADVERYPEFLPWCTEARIRSARHARARERTCARELHDAKPPGAGPLDDDEPRRGALRPARGSLGLCADRRRGHARGPLDAVRDSRPARRARARARLRGRLQPPGRRLRAPRAPGLR